MSDDTFTTIINQILQGLVSTINGAIGPAISSAGYDPYQNVASGSHGIGVGTAHYSVTHLTGVSSLRFQQLVASNVVVSGATLTGTLNFHAALGSSLNTTVGGGLKVLFVDVGISGNARIDGGSVSGTAQLHATMSATQLCLNSVTGLSANFNYSNASIWIDSLGPLNYLLQPLENLILDATKGSIRNLISSDINGIVTQEINRRLPQCQPL